jgi:hypothetical protein
MRLNIFVSVCLLLGVVLGGCKKPQDKLLGTWKTTTDGQVVYFTFQKNNDLNVNNQVFMKYFITKKNNLILGREEPAPFSIKGKTLRIEQAEHTLLFERVR